MYVPERSPVREVEEGELGQGLEHLQLLAPQAALLRAPLGRAGAKSALAAVGRPAVAPRHRYWPTFRPTFSELRAHMGENRPIFGVVRRGTALNYQRINIFVSHSSSQKIK